MYMYMYMKNHCQSWSKNHTPYYVWLSSSPPLPSLYLSLFSVVYFLPYPSSTYEAALLKALSPFEKAYISRSQTRLIDVVNQLFGVGSRTLPKEEEILSAVKTIGR